MIYYLYNILLCLAYPALAVFFLLKGRGDIRYIGTMPERYGKYPSVMRKPAGKKRLWVHAVSVGEVIGALPLIRVANEQLSGYDIVISTTTKTGRDMLLKNLPNSKTFYFPFDFPWVARRALNAIAPDALVIMETELWPNLITMCRLRGLPVLMLNGRVSDRMAAAGGAARAMYSWTSSRMNALGVQTQRDAERLIALGAPAAKVHVVGNMKFEGILSNLDESNIENLGKTINPSGGKLFAAGSTHPGEEEIILNVFAEVRKSHPDLLLVIAPRHIERTDEVEGIAIMKNFTVARRTRMSAGTARPETPDVVLLDTIGELRLLYALATICFVGGSLVERGGHNVLEPAACGRAPFYGPSTANFTDSVRVLEQGGGGRPVKDAGELAAKIIDCLDNEAQAAETDERARNVILDNAGATERAFKLLVSNL